MKMMWINIAMQGKNKINFQSQKFSMIYKNYNWIMKRNKKSDQMKIKSKMKSCKLKKIQKIF